MIHYACAVPERCRCKCSACAFVRELRQAKALTAYTAAKGAEKVPTKTRLRAAMEAIGVSP